jgi:hypothetical protein
MNPNRIGKRHNEGFVVSVRPEPCDASVSVPLTGRWTLDKMRLDIADVGLPQQRYSACLMSANRGDGGC